jgi:hypothetical protein
MLRERKTILLKTKCGELPDVPPLKKKRRA